MLLEFGIDGFRNPRMEAVQTLKGAMVNLVITFGKRSTQKLAIWHY